MISYLGTNLKTLFDAAAMLLPSTTNTQLCG